MITPLHVKTFMKKLYLWAKKFWWAIILGLLFVVAGLVSMLTKNAGVLTKVLDLIDANRDAHDQEMETLAHIHNNEVAEKNDRLREHTARRAEIESELKKKGESLTKEKEAELKRLVDESYNDPDELDRKLAEAFGL